MKCGADLTLGVLLQYSSGGTKEYLSRRMTKRLWRLMLVMVEITSADQPAARPVGAPGARIALHPGVTGLQW
jgi:hypothetical protein